MIFVVSHRRRRGGGEGGSGEVTKIHREVRLEPQTELVVAPFKPSQSSVVLDAAAIHSRLDREAQQRLRDVQALRSQTSSQPLLRSPAVKRKQLAAPFPSPPPAGATSAATPKKQSPLFPAAKRRGMEHIEFVSPPSPIAVLQPSPSPTQINLSGDSSSSSSDSSFTNNSDLDDRDSREFCRARRISSLGARREQILLLMKTIPSSRQTYTKELSELDALLFALSNQPATTSPFKPAKPSEDPVQEEEEKEEPAASASPSPPPPPPPPPLPELVTFDWTLFAKAFVDRLVDRKVLTIQAFNELERDLQQSDLEWAKQERRQVFGLLNQVCLDRQSRTLPEQINTFVVELAASVGERGEFSVLQPSEVEDYVLRQVVRVPLDRFSAGGDGPFLPQDFDQVEGELAKFGPTQRKLVFDCFVEHVQRLYPGEFAPPSSPSSFSSIRELVRRGKRIPQDKEVFRQEIKDRMFLFSPLAYWGATLSFSDATIIAQNLAKHALALEDFQ